MEHRLIADQPAHADGAEVCADAEKLERGELELVQPFENDERLAADAARVVCDEVGATRLGAERV
ncbi:MAG: hypothetical protein JNK82_38265 [Myxococcaceae bacterium]|nr:hypothetical protein [Myxococcaceae bacterium]